VCVHNSPHVAAGALASRAYLEVSLGVERLAPVYRPYTRTCTYLYPSTYIHVSHISVMSLKKLISYLPTYCKHAHIHAIQVSVSAVFCLDILQLNSIGLSFDWHSVYFVQL